MSRTWAGAAGVVLIELAAVGLDACGSSGSTSGPSSPGPDSGSETDAGGSGSSSGGNATDGASSSSGSGSSSGGDATPDAPSVLATCQTSAPGVTDCGSPSESCCTSIHVPGGTYYRTFSVGADGGLASASDPATVSAFRLDKYEVTVGRFRQFVAAWGGGAGYTPPAGSGKHTHLNGSQGLVGAGGVGEPGWVATDDVNVAPTDANLSSCAPYSTWTGTASTQEHLPINCVNWYEAYAFCIWDGGFLPSDAEWEAAAAGGSMQREYPWGYTPPGMGDQYAVYGFDFLDASAPTAGCYYPSAGLCTGVVNIAPVGSVPAGAGAWGHLDLSGNAFEWVLDTWNVALVDPCLDCAQLASAPNRVQRGGAFNSYSALQLTSWYRSDTRGRNDFGGFRCARTP